MSQVIAYTAHFGLLIIRHALDRFVLLNRLQAQSMSLKSPKDSATARKVRAAQNRVEY
ncbi:hypothetical protein EHS25_008467 [Saitozyma podzolica]|uniref:Uncharacterized protein n=1 Tax=Saitozyma podzolica TaxID=1890683 RepID=A0A427YPL8_9TREE|nr:hypothetical protein EHS25_008467 [Saitozyma podzolica]